MFKQATTSCMAFVAALVLLPSVAVAQVEGPEVKWDLNAHGGSRALTRGIEAMSAYVSEQTGGNFQIEIHYGGALGRPEDNIDSIKLGAFEMGLWCSCWSPAKAPALSALTLPFLPLENIDELARVQQSYLGHPALVEEAANWGAIYLTTQLIPESTLMAKGDVPTSLEDLAGLRIRAIGNGARVVELLGATSVAMPSPDTYQGLQRGTMDGVSFPIYGYSAFKIDELSNWYSDDIKFGRLVTVTLVNKTAFDDLSEQYQQVLRDAVPIAQEALKAAYAGIEEVNFPKWADMGIERVRFDSNAVAAMEAENSAPIFADWVETVSERGVPGQELLDFLLSEASGS
ncbi:MAG: TRAP transporter substrate-binding protein DctP [Bacteroidetes bacterium]|nr:TRAP transporter substrate-binding protein DctP [Bacteroidota bacterium]